MEHGQFGLAGSIAFLRGRSPFVIEPPNAAWARELHGFGWLRNLDAAGSEEARTTGRQLALEWTIRFGTDRGVAAEPAVIGAPAHLLAVACQPAARRTPTRRSYGAITASLGRQLAQLSRSLARGPHGLSAPACLDGAGVRDAVARRARPANQGHRERAWRRSSLGRCSPTAATSRAIRAARRAAARPAAAQPMFHRARPHSCPEQLGEALERMLPMLRYLRLGNGMVARFNGMGCAPAAGLATVLAYDDGSLPPLGEARAFRLCAARARRCHRRCRCRPAAAAGAVGERASRLPVVRNERRQAAAVRQRRRAGSGERRLVSGGARHGQPQHADAGGEIIFVSWTRADR